MNFQKLLFDNFHFIALCFSNITLIVIPSTSKNCRWYYLHFAYRMFRTQQVNQIFIVAIKTMVYFISLFSCGHSEFFSIIYFFTNLTPKTTKPSTPYLSFHRIQLTSHYDAIFYFSSTYVWYHQRRWELLHHCIRCIYICDNSFYAIIASCNLIKTKIKSYCMFISFITLIWFSTKFYFQSEILK